MSCNENWICFFPRNRITNAFHTFLTWAFGQKISINIWNVKNPWCTHLIEFFQIKESSNTSLVLSNLRLHSALDLTKFYKKCNLVCIMMHRQNVTRQNVPGDKMSRGTKCPRDKTSQGQNIPRDKMSQGTKHPKVTNEAQYLTWCGQSPNPIWSG